MRFPLYQKHAMAQLMVRDLVQKEVAPVINGFDRKQGLISFTCEELATKGASFRVAVDGSETLGIIQARYKLGRLPAYKQG